jgi:hypothetical protein
MHHISALEQPTMPSDLDQKITVSERVSLALAVAIGWAVIGFVLYLFLVFGGMPPGSSFGATATWYGFLFVAISSVIYSYYKPRRPGRRR